MNIASQTVVMKKFQKPVATVPKSGVVATAIGVGKENLEGEEGEEEWEVLFAKKGPKKHPKWEDGLVKRETNGIAADRLLLVDADGTQIGRATVKKTTPTPLMVDSENDKLFGAYRIQVVGQTKASKKRVAPPLEGPARKKVAAPTTGFFAMPASRVPIRERQTNVLGAGGRAARLAVVKKEKAANYVLLQDPKVELLGSFAAKLRPHQLEAVKMLYTCLSGRNGENCNGGSGAILADEMGLGKTLTTLALLRVLCKASGCAVNEDSQLRRVRKAAVICPASLVGQWRAENHKWFGSVSNVTFIAALETAGGSYDGKTETVKDSIRRWITADARRRNTSFVLVVSYETCTRHAEDVLRHSQLDMLILDEGHRLKNTATTKAGAAIKESSARKRLLLTGTPAANNLDEFWALADVVNPGALGSLDEFRKVTARRIETGARRGASECQTNDARTATEDVRDLAKTWYLRRRAADVERKSLPDKIEHIVCCAMTAKQKEAYRTAAFRQRLNFDLTAVSELRALSTRGPAAKAEDDAGVAATSLLESSGKLSFLVELVQATRNRPEDDRLVIVSTSTQTLDVVETLCAAKGWRFSRLDGSTSAEKRSNIVRLFNSKGSKDDLFLLSSKAGGCGINLVGANRLVLLDADWNPATDEQAMARVWRDGQTKPVYVYRLLSTATIDEKIMQRQFAKHRVADTVVDGTENRGGGGLDPNELKALFEYDDRTDSTTRDAMAGAADDSDAEAKDDDWPRYDGAHTIDSDDVLREAALRRPHLVTYLRTSLFKADGRPPQVLSGARCGGGEGSRPPTAAQRKRRVIREEEEE